MKTASKPLTSKQRNKAIEKLNDFDFRDQAHALTFLLGGGTEAEKPVLYMGWYWREVDFDKDIHLAVTSDGTTGFCENNKWGYRQFRLTTEQKTELLGVIDKAIATHDWDDVRAINVLMRTYGEPHKGKGYYDE